MNSLNIGRKIVNDNSLILYLDAGNPQSYSGTGTTWYDLSKYQNHGTLINNPTFIPSIADGTFYFTSTIPSYATTTNLSNLSPSSSFTINVWTNNSGILISTYVADNITGYFSGAYIYDIPGIIYFSFSDGSSNTTNLQLSGTPPILNFYNYTATYDGSNDANGMKIYINGSLLSTNIDSNIPLIQSPSYNIPWLINTTYIDMPPLTPYVSQDAGTSIVQIYNRALSEKEIIQSYNNTKGRFGIF